MPSQPTNEKHPRVSHNFTYAFPFYPFLHLNTCRDIIWRARGGVYQNTPECDRRQAPCGDDSVSSYQWSVRVNIEVVFVIFTFSSLHWRAMWAAKQSRWWNEMLTIISRFFWWYVVLYVAVVARFASTWPTLKKTSFNDKVYFDSSFVLSLILLIYQQKRSVSYVSITGFL